MDFKKFGALLAWFGFAICVVGAGIAIEGGSRIMAVHKDSDEHAIQDMREVLDIGMLKPDTERRHAAYDAETAIGEDHKEKGLYVGIAGAIVIFLGVALRMSAKESSGTMPAQKPNSSPSSEQ